MRCSMEKFLLALLYDPIKKKFLEKITSPVSDARRTGLHPGRVRSPEASNAQLQKMKLFSKISMDTLG